MYWQVVTVDSHANLRDYNLGWKGTEHMSFFSNDQALSMFAEDRPLIKQVVSIFFISVILKLWSNSGKPNCP